MSGLRSISALLLACFVCAMAWAEDKEAPIAPQPSLPVGVASCVEPTEIMRRRHMDFLDHQRDATVIDGIRTPQHSLVGCIDCHVQPDATGKVARSDDPEHFCAGCHLFTGVKIDCFECHADRPVAFSSVSDALQHKFDMEQSAKLAALDAKIPATLSTSEIRALQPAEPRDD